MDLLLKMIICSLVSFVVGFIMGILIKRKNNRIGKIQVDDGNENIIFRLEFSKDPINMRDMKEVIFTIEKDASLTMPDEPR